MKKNRLLPIFVFLLGTLMSFQASSQCAKYEPPEGKVLYIIGQDNNATGQAGYGDGYCDDPQLGSKAPAGVTIYYSLGVQPGSGLNTLINWGAGPLHASRYLQNEYWDNSVISVGLYMASGGSVMSDITNGGRNAHIDALINWIKAASPRPVYLRIGYEFDYQYAGNPAGYVDAWKYIVDRFRAAKVSNVAYVWQAGSGIGSEGHLRQWYPGDDYVDWLGYSHFEFFGNQNEGSGIIAMARNIGKPVMIAEAMPHGYELDNASSANAAWTNYFQEVISEIESNSDVIKGFCYINQDWEAQWLWVDQGWGDSRIQGSVIESNWAQEMESPKWLHASPQLFDLLETCGIDLELEADGGGNKEVILPDNSVTLNGKGLYGTPPYRFTWSQLSGPSTLTLPDLDNANQSLTDLEEGTYTLRLEVEDAEGTIAVDEVRVSVTDVPQFPFPDNGPAQIPGTFQAEEYDIGGQGVSYADNSQGNQGNAFREDDVDIGTAPSGHAVAWTDEGEWLEYTVNIQEYGFYTFTFDVATTLSGGTLWLTLDGDEVMPPIDVPVSGNWNSYIPVSKSDIKLPGGEHVLRINLSGAFNLDQVASRLDLINGINAAAQSPRWSISPNPVTNSLDISSSEPIEIWTVLSSVGTVLKSGTGNHILTQDLPQGVYQLLTNLGSTTFVKQ